MGFQADVWARHATMENSNYFLLWKFWAMIGSFQAKSSPVTRTIRSTVHLLYVA